MQIHAFYKEFTVKGLSQNLPVPFYKLITISSLQNKPEFKQVLNLHSLFSVIIKFSQKNSNNVTSYKHTKYKQFLFSKTTPSNFTIPLHFCAPKLKLILQEHFPHCQIKKEMYSLE